MIRSDATLIDYVGPSGRCYPLSGPRVGAMGVQLLRGVKGWLGPPSRIITDGAARQHGFDVTGVSVGAAEYDWSFDVWGRTPHEWSVVNRMWLDDWDFLRPGFVRAYTSDTGWRWAQVRQGRDHQGDFVIDPRRTRVATYKQVAIAPDAYWRSRDYEKSWTDTGEHLWRVKLWNGGDVAAWPTFTLEGQCSFRIRWAENDFTIPALRAGESATVYASHTQQTIRTINADGSRGRNLLPALKGRYFLDPIPAGRIATVIVETIGGTGKVYARVPQQFKRPF